MLLDVIITRAQEHSHSFLLNADVIFESVIIEVNNYNGDKERIYCVDTYYLYLQQIKCVFSSNQFNQ